MNLFHSYIAELKNALDDLSEEEIDQVLEILHTARLTNQQVFIMGNGGSASTASHFGCDLWKNTRVQGVPNFRVIGLTDNIALFSALAAIVRRSGSRADSRKSHRRGANRREARRESLQVKTSPSEDRHRASDLPFPAPRA